MITLKKGGQWHTFFGRFEFEPRNLCSLFWGGALLPFGVFVGGTLAALVAIYSLLAWGHFFLLFFGILWPWGGVTGRLMLALLAIEMGVLLFVLASTLAGLVKYKVSETSAGQIVREGYRGFKDKFCPLVTWL